MCVVSAVMQYGNDEYRRRLDELQKQWPSWTPSQPLTSIPRKLEQDLAQLRKDFEEFKKLILSAKEYDEKTGQPDCELESKKDSIRKIAEQLGVQVSFS